MSGLGLDVAYLSRLARLPLSDAEARMFQVQLDTVVRYVEELAAVDIAEVEATAHAAPVQNVFREDEPHPCLDRGEVLRNAPHEDGEHILVPIIVP